MARNCEKKLIGLNRLWLEKQQKEELEKNPKRPHLHSLNSAAEVKKWIPAIKREIDYCLDQISGARQHRYPDTKIKEFESKVEELEKEYKRFVKKVYELDPSTTGVPWQPRGYVSKRKNVESSGTAGSKPKKICTPLLDEEHQGRTSAPTRSDKEDRQSSELTYATQERDSVVISKTNEDNSKSLELQQGDVNIQPKSLVTRAPERVKLLTMNTEDGKDVLSEVCSCRQLSHRLGSDQSSQQVLTERTCTEAYSQ